MKKSLLFLLAFPFLFSACTVVETRAKSQSAGNRDAVVHYFMFRATKTDADRISAVFNPPPLEDNFATHSNDWQLRGLSSFVNIPISAVTDLLCLPVDAIICDEALPDTSVQVYWGNAPIKKIRVTQVRVIHGHAPKITVYENNHPDLMKVVNDLIAELPAHGSVYNKNIGHYPKARIDFYSTDGKIYYLEDYEGYLEAPIVEFGRFYGDTYARETAIRRIIENIEFIKGSRELD